jgi:two-component system CheB/CheR fusion protein
MSESRPQQAKTARPQSGGRPLVLPGSPLHQGEFSVVGIGASAGGLEACRKLIGALPAGNGMAFILVQHLDPNHESMMVDLLVGSTTMTVRQATDGMPIAPNHLYVIPPGTYLSVVNGALHLSSPQARHGARMPFDFLLHSLAEAYGERAICVILSGTGADGSVGLLAVKEKGGLVIAQDPDEADYDGMPRSAIATGAVDCVLPVAKMPPALRDRGISSISAESGDSPEEMAENLLPDIIELLRTKTAHDFRLYKPGTLLRRIERRMAMSAIKADDVDGYLELLRGDATELDLLAKDLLINVTGFFRDPKVFELLAGKIFPDLIRSLSVDHPLRVWVAGCSTGEETYSLAMLLHEEIAAANRNTRLQIFASDVDPDAIAEAREGLYPDSIEKDVSPARLGAFFSKEEHGYRVSPELRASIVFTVQDVLADPPFSRLDLVSCRNLLIYLRPEAQAKVISLFHFALRPGGFLLLGNAETAGDVDGRFDVISKSARLYRHIGRSRPGEFGALLGLGEGARVSPRLGQIDAPSRRAAFAELCRRLVMERYAPAAVLINYKRECLYSVGPTDRYLRVAPGSPSHDLLAMARQGLRTKLLAAIHQAREENARVVVPGGQLSQDGLVDSFNIDVLPVRHEGEDLQLICFAETPKQVAQQSRPSTSDEITRVAELERELAATKADLLSAVRDLEVSNEEQNAVNEEALSVNEEFQSTNEELVTSKEELQSLNEELTALNSQLQETLERQRTTANDLQNILYSTNVATIFLDTNLNIRFFTPATKLLFRIIPGDIGRPLADLNSLAADGALLCDARSVMQNSAPIEREIESANGAWYLRRVLPYRADDNGVEGVVITFADITGQKRIADALAVAKQKAELATVAKSRFLAAASHDLRQPLQTLALVQELLAKAAVGEKAQKLVVRLDETLGAISGMLNTLLDINQIETGTVAAEMVDFPINDLFERMTGEFTYHAQARRLALRVVPSSLVVRSDPRLIEQMVRNLLSNALKFTKRGKVLLGCRRRQGMVSVEVWDSGIGIPNGELEAIFEEYYQLDNAARERSCGMGMGLSIVHRLVTLLGHRIRVNSTLGKGSVFAIEVERSAGGAAPKLLPGHAGSAGGRVGADHQAGVILVVEDDPELRELLAQLLWDAGHQAPTAADGVLALDMVVRGEVRPDLVLADYNLPNGLNGLQLAAKLRKRLRREVPVIVLTGDISSGTLREVAIGNCVHLTKPVKVKELMEVIRNLLPPPIVASVHAPPPADAIGAAPQPVIYVVDDDANIRWSLRDILEADGRIVEDYGTSEAFLEAYRPGQEGCLLIDAYLPGMNGFELLQRLGEAGHSLPSIMITGKADVPMAVEAMKAGALDFIEKPISGHELLASVGRALEHSKDVSKLSAWREDAANHVAGLTPRQHQIMDMVLAGHPNKNIAADLGISQRTVENHRASIMRKTGSRSLPALARLAVAAAANQPPT